MEDRFTPTYSRQRGPTKVDTPQPAPLRYETGTHVRNLCLIWPTGNRKFFNYAYLVSGEFLAGENIIRLIFSNETVFMEGSNLLSLFTELLEHLPKEIICGNDRYAALSDEDRPFVSKISIEANT